MPRKRRRRQALGGELPLQEARPVATLDLHGFTASEAERAVRNFLQTWQRRAPKRVVRIVTGKGLGSGAPPVLRGRVGRMLAGDLAPLVRANEMDTDQGCWLVRLR